MTVRVELPQFLRRLAQVPDGEVRVEVSSATVGAVLDELEERHPALRGTIRDQATGVRRPFLRFFACQEDWSHEAMDAALPEAVASGREPLLIVGAIAGG
jgi:hypothetical protein